MLYRAAQQLPIAAMPTFDIMEGFPIANIGQIRGREKVQDVAKRR